MSIRQANGTIVSKTTLMTYMTDVTPTENKVYQYTGNSGATLFEGVHYDGASTFEGYRRKAFIAGQTYRQDQIDKFFPTCTISTVVVAATGAAATALATAGGTALKITGTGFSGATGVTFGGTAGTSFSVASDTVILVTSPAKTAASYDVVVADDGGNVTKTNGVTYV